jgi:hypothetical protein
MLPGPKKSTSSVVPKSEVQCALEEVTEDILSTVSDLQKSYIEDFKKIIGATPLQQLNFNAITRDAPLFYQLMEGAQDCKTLGSALIELFSRIPIRKLNWNVDVKRGATICSPLLLLMRRAAMGQEWAQKTVPEVFKHFPINELVLDRMETEDAYQDQTIFGMLLYCAYDNKLWACTALKIVLTKVEIDTELNIDEIAALGLLVYLVLTDTAWTLDGIKTVCQTSLRHFYGWVAIIANEQVVSPSATELMARLAVLGYPRFMQKFLSINENSPLDVNQTVSEESVIDILSSYPKTRGLACQVMLHILCNNRNVMANNQKFVNVIINIIAETAKKHFESASYHDPNESRKILAKALGKALEEYLAHMVTKEKGNLLTRFITIFLQKRAALQPVIIPEPLTPVDYEELAASFGYHLNISTRRPEPALLLLLERFTSQSEESGTPLLPPSSPHPSPKP